MISFEENGIAQILKYRFQNPTLLRQALTRQSAISEGVQKASLDNYQRLEFLGDSVLNMVVADLIYEMFPNRKEEDLTTFRSILARNETLGTLGLQLELGDFLIMGKGEERQNHRHNKRVLADLVESLIGAVYIDSGRNFPLTKSVVLNLLRPIMFSSNIFEHRSQVSTYIRLLEPLEETCSQIPNIQPESSGLKNLWKIVPQNWDKSKINTLCEKNIQNLFFHYDILTLQCDDFVPNANLIPFLNSLTDYMLNSYTNLEIKKHFISSSLLLHFLINLPPQFNISPEINLACLLHNGIAEHYRRNFDKSNYLLNKALTIIEIVESSKDFQYFSKNFIVQNKSLLVYYYADNAFMTHDITIMNRCIQIIKHQNSDDNLEIMHSRKINVQYFILNDDPDTNLKNYFRMLHIDKDEIKNSIRFLKLYLDIKLLKWLTIHCNKNFQTPNTFREFYTLEKEVLDSFGKTTILLQPIYSFFIVYYESLDTTAQINLDRLAHYSDKLSKLHFELFTVDAQALLQTLNKNAEIVNLYTKLD